MLRFLSRKRLASRLPAYAGEARNEDRSALALLDADMKLMAYSDEAFTHNTEFLQSLR